MELLYNGICSSLIYWFLFDIHVAAQNILRTFPKAITFPHYNPHLFNREVLKHRCSHKRLQSRREDHKQRNKERRREGVRGAVWAPGSKSGFLNKQRHRVMMASQQGAWAEPCYSCRFIHPQVLIGRILVEQVLGLGWGRKTVRARDPSCTLCSAFLPGSIVSSTRYRSSFLQVRAWVLGWSGD